VLPIDAILPALGTALARHPSAVLSAPPGSGKTTRVPLALLDQPWLAGRKILLLEPRRLAARAAARFMAHRLGEDLGQTVGYRVRLDSRVGAATRIEVLTEGVLTRRLQQDPELAGVGLVIFDEFHERSLQADLGLALCLDVQQGLREDLRLLLMSATLEPAPLATLLGDAAVLEAPGRSFPVETLYDPSPDPERTPQALARAALRGVQRALHEQSGDLLVFLPGVGEIRRAEGLLQERLQGSGVRICPLYGELDATAQDRALRPAPGGARRVVLATSIAETSLTIEGVRVVVDTGWSRRPRFDPNTGLTGLVTERVSRSAAEQRRGRAGRLGPGVCYRLWSEQVALSPQPAAEVLQADLAPLVLELALWGVEEPRALRWLDPPPTGATAQARGLLQGLDALDARGRITPLGRRMAALPLHPRLAHMLLRAAEQGDVARAADLAALLGERDIVRSRPGEARPLDLEGRLEALARRHDQRGADPHGPLDPGACATVAQIARQLRRLVGRGAAMDRGEDLSVGALVALAYPDRVAQGRGRHAHFLLANGRGARVPEGDPLAAAPYLAVAALDARVQDGQVFLAARLEREELERLFAGRIEAREQVTWDTERGAVSARRVRTLGALVLDSTPLPRPAPGQVLPALLAGIRAMGSHCLPWNAAARALQARVLSLRAWEPEGDWPDLGDAALLRDAEQRLGPWLAGVSRLAELGRLDLAEVLRSTLDWEARRWLDVLAPERIPVPSGGLRVLAYQPGESPVLAVRLQEMFGQRETPRVCQGRIPVTLHLLSPARRPLQITQDLAGFWDRTYAEVRKEMRARYPKHYWPEDPRQAQPTHRLRPPKPD